jgi:2-polyprenyl-6-methoxyphenol hydroxylase-like FAD-dependent oxidoreductase
MVGIVGGGIAGLTLALALEKLDVDYQLFEKAETLNEVGAGIWLAPNALQVLSWLAVLYDVRLLGNEIDQMSITDKLMNPFNTASQEWIKEKFGYSTYAIHRAKLQTLLYKRIPPAKIKLGYSFTEVQKIKGRNTANIVFENGEEIETDCLIGADGIHSKIRSQIFPKSMIRYSGQTCWRGISNIKLPNDLQHQGFELWGEEIRFGFSRISENQVYWFAVCKSPPQMEDVTENLLERLFDMYKDYNPLVCRIITNTPIDKILRNDINDLERLPKWYNNLVCLIGDAAHATTPNMGQGGAQAIEDAYFLSHYIMTKESYPQAFEKFQQKRTKKIKGIVNQSWQMGQLAHWKYLNGFRNTLLKLTPQSFVNKSLEKLYSLDPL